MINCLTKCSLSVRLRQLFHSWPLLQNVHWTTALEHTIKVEVLGSINSWANHAIALVCKGALGMLILSVVIGLWLYYLHILVSASLSIDQRLHTAQFHYFQLSFPLSLFLLYFYYLVLLLCTVLVLFEIPAHRLYGVFIQRLHGMVLLPGSEGPWVLTINCSIIKHLAEIHRQKELWGSSIQTE